MIVHKGLTAFTILLLLFSFPFIPSSSFVKSNKKDDSIPDACSISEEDVISSDLDNEVSYYVSFFFCSSRIFSLLLIRLIVSKLHFQSYPGGHLSIIYGSQTGTAAGFAQQLCDESSNYGFKSRLVDMEDITSSDDVTAKLLHKSFQDENGKARMIVVVATYGEGESTDNATEMVRFLKNSIEEQQQQQQIFSNLDYCVFGLGNRQYEHYNAMGIFFDKSLHKLGGTRIMEVGLGDDDQDLESDFDAWKENMWSEFTKRYSPKSSGEHQETTAKLPVATAANTHCPFKVEYLPEMHGNPNVKPDVVSLDHVNKQTKHYFTSIDCPISVVRELRSKNDDGSTLHIEVDVSSRKEEIQYETAANLAILPINNTSIVETVAKALSFDLDAVFRLKSSKGDDDEGFQQIFPTPCTVRDLLSRYCDLTSPPRRSELSALANYATNALDKKALQRMSSKEGREEYKEKIVDLHVGIADIVSTLCPSISMSLEHFIHVCPRLQPRFYTISSSSSLHPHSVHLTVGVMRGARNHGNGGEWFGVCSGHLSNIATNINGSFGGANPPTCRIFVRSSTFRLPSDVSKQKSFNSDPLLVYLIFRIFA